VTRARYLAVSFLHPRLVRGGAQQVAYELFLGARADADVSARFLGAVSPALAQTHAPPGAVFTGIDGLPDESLLLYHGFDFREQRQTSHFVIEKIDEFFATNTFDWIHFHHSLGIGLDAILLARRRQPKARILYTLHDYMPICAADGQLKKRDGGGFCLDYSPQACAKCFPDLGVDEFFLRNAMFRKAFGSIDHFIAPSEFCRQRFLQWGLRAEDVSVIPNGQRNLNDGAVAPRARRPGDPTRFAFFGQMIDNKGAHLLIEAARRLADRWRAAGGTDAEGRRRATLPFGVDFYGGNIDLASEGYRERIAALLAACDDDLRRALVFHGEYTHEQIPAIMRSVDCVVTPSTWFEVFALVVSEAWMFGKPVIAADIGALSERIEDGVNGLKFAPGDADALAGAMATFMEAPISPEANLAAFAVSDRESFWTAHRSLFERPASRGRSTRRASARAP
jgi:glycosyltransferase involved in cell wall biosynthesis